MDLEPLTFKVDNLPNEDYFSTQKLQGEKGRRYLEISNEKKERRGYL